MSFIHKRFLLRAIFLFALAFAPQAWGDDADDDKFHRFSVSLGVFITDYESESRLNGSIGEDDSVIDLEGSLGLDRSDSVFRLDGYIRFNERHRLDVSIFDLSRNKTTVIDEEIEWDDTIYPINASIRNAFDLTIYKLAYTWSFLRRDKGYLGATAGIYTASLGAVLSEPQIGRLELYDLTAPLPVFGVRGEYALSDKWTLRASSEIFAIEYDEYDGRFIDLYAGIDYRLWRNAALGIGLNSVSLDIDVSRKSFDGSFDWSYNGAFVFLKFDF
jgi:hypothetical protein